MGTIKNLVFDLGGVIVDLDIDRAIERFVEIGVADAGSMMDKYHQKGIFLEIEDGRLDAEEFCNKLSTFSRKKLTLEEVQYAWLGFIKDVPQYKLDFIRGLRSQFKVYLLSNTNPLVMSWARSNAFSRSGMPIEAYLDKVYASYEIGLVKPDKAIFEHMIEDASLIPSETLFIDDGIANINTANELGFHTYLAKNGMDWRNDISLMANL